MNAMGRNTIDLIRRAALPALALLTIAYFLGYAIVGANGILSWGDYRRLKSDRLVQLAQLDQEKARLAHRADLLDPRRADPDMITDVYDQSTGPGGVARAGSPMVCVNPLTGTRGAAAPKEANLGSLVPNSDFSNATFTPRAVPARCDVRGFLLIGDTGSLPEFGRYVLPGNNYHVFDYALFWANLRADAERRLAAFERQ